MARGMVVVLRARLGVDPEQVVDRLHNARSRHVAGVEFGRLEELPARVRPAGGMHHLRPAHAVIGDLAVGLQNAFELSQKLLGSVAPPPQAEAEHYAASRSAVLP